MKDIQFNPVTDRVRHIDFLEVGEKKAFTIDVPVYFAGQPLGVQAGGNFSKRRRYLSIKGLLNNIPNTLNVDVSNLEIGHSLRIGDVEVKDVTVMDEAQLTLCSVNVSRVALQAAADAEETGAEGEDGAEAPAEGEAKEEVKEEAKE